MSKELIGSHSVHETLVRQTQIDAACIEELESDRDEWKARAEFSYKQRDELEREIERKMSAAAFVLKERDALIADNARLREAMKEIRDDFDCDNDAHRYGATCRCCLAEKTLDATPEQSLAAYRNKAIEAFVNEFSRHVGGDGEFWLHELQYFAMKEQP